MTHFQMKLNEIQKKKLQHKNSDVFEAGTGK